jgi:hypothetical protein
MNNKFKMRALSWLLMIACTGVLTNCKRQPGAAIPNIHLEISRSKKSVDVNKTNSLIVTQVSPPPKFHETYSSNGSPLVEIFYDFSNDQIVIKNLAKDRHCNVSLQYVD